MRIEKKLGKLVRLDFEQDPTNTKITSMKITGDFFIHPESAITEIETLFLNQKLPLKISSKQTKTINAQIIGFTIPQLEELINNAVH